jgi:deoxyribonuclease V
MILAIDVQYYDDYARAAGVLFEHWDDAKPVKEIIRLLHPSQYGEYVPGHFYKRELPCIMAIVEALDEKVTAIIVDGYVDLDEKPGLGRHLYHKVGVEIPIIIGVAKSRFKKAVCLEVQRESGKPLYVTSTNDYITSILDDRIKSMHGKFRNPTLLKRVDHLARGFK